jgi:hypothetical protein
MKLHSPNFETKLRSGVKREIRSSAELRRQFRASKLRKHYNSTVILRPAFSIAFWFLTWRVAGMTQHAASALAGVAVWAFVFIFVHAQSLWNHLYRSKDSAALMLLPIPSAIIFRWETHKFARASLRSLVDILAGYVAVAAFFKLPHIAWFFVVAAAGLTWAVSVALGTLAAAWLPRSPFQLIIGTFLLTGVALFVMQKLVGLAWVVEVFDRTAPALNILLPTGWPGLLLQLATPERHWMAVGLVLPLAAIIWGWKKSLAQLCEDYVYIEPVLPRAPDIVPGSPPGPGPLFQESPVRVGQTTIEEIIQNRTFLQSVQWHDAGPLEKLLWRWLTLRERRISEFLFPHGLMLWRWWLTFFKKFALALVAGFTAGLISPVLKVSILGLTLFVSFCVVLARIAETGRGFQKVSWSGLNVPLYAGYPIGLREMSRLLLKYSTVQFPAILLWSVIVGILSADYMNLPLMDGVWQGLRGGCLLIASKFIFLVFSFSSGTNDSARIRFRAMFLLCAMLLFGGTFLLSGGFGLVCPKHGLGWLLTLGAMLDAYLFFIVYQWFYHSGRFDLMNVSSR